jgi:2-polyprenyl-3-methyl-5-hydroxy-6-metoxy-1,4-benzoquinol methylase
MSREQAQGSALAQGELWGAEASGWAEFQEPQHRPLYDEAIRRTGISRGVAVLDAGCGAGVMCRLAADAGARVSGIDAAAPLVEIARRRVPTGGFAVCDLQFLPYADDTFDVVTGFNSFQYAADPEAAIREAGRVARPGGSVFLAVWGREERTQLVAMMDALKPLLPPAPPNAPGPFALSHPGALERLVERAGLASVDSGYLGATFEYRDEATLLRAQSAAGPSVLAARLSGRDAVRAAISASLAACRTAAGGYRVEIEWRYALAAAA